MLLALLHVLAISASGHLRGSPAVSNIRALIIRIGFWGPLYISIKIGIPKIVLVVI